MIVQRVCALAYFRAPHWCRFPVLISEPLAELDNLRLVACEINVFRTFKQPQHVQIVGQLPIILIHSALCRKIRRVHEEQHTWIVTVQVKQILVIKMHDFQSVQIAVGAVVTAVDAVIHRVSAQFVQALGPLAGEKHGATYCKNIGIAILFLIVVHYIQDVGALPV